MRIAFFTDSYIPNVDGVVTSILNHKRELEKRGHEVFVFCPGTRKQKKENKDPNVYYFTSTTFKPYPDYRLALFPFFSAVKKVKKANIDIIHSHGIATTGLAAIQCSNKLKIPILASFHTLVPEAMHYITKNNQIEGFLKSVAWKYLIWYYSHFLKVLIPSNCIKNILEKHNIQNLQVHIAGIDEKRFNQLVDGSEIRKRYKLKNNPLILHIGRVAMEKRLEYIINSADNVLNSYPNAKFMIVGKGPAMEHYKNLVNSKGLSKNFIFTGYIPDKDVPKYYAASDVLVFPSNFDTQGLVVLESLFVGTPVVALEGSAPSEFIVNGKTGYLFSDHFDIHEKIILSIKNKEELSKNAAKTSKKYTIKKSTDSLLFIYNSILSSQ